MAPAPPVKYLEPEMGAGSRVIIPEVGEEPRITRNFCCPPRWVRGCSGTLQGDRRRVPTHPIGSDRCIGVVRF